MSERRAQGGILIIGAGLAGLTLALLTAKEGVKTTVVEKQGSIEPSRWTIFLYPTAIRLFDELGVLEDLKKLGIPLRSPEIVTDRAERLATVETSMLLEPRLNYNLLLGPSEIRQILRERALSEGVEILEGVSFKETIRDPQGKISGVRLGRDGESLQISSKVIVGADGYKSRVRQSFGSRTTERSYPVVVGFFLKHEHGLDRMKMVLGDGSQMVVLPNTKTRLNVGYTEHGLDIERVRQADGVRYVKDRMIRSAPFLKDAIEGGIASSDESMLVIEPKAIHVEPWVVDGGVLIGDAGHAFHPGTGMGAEQAFRDAVALSPILVDCVNKDDFGLQALMRFERERRPFMNFLENTNNRNVSMQLSRGRARIWLRNRAFRATGKLIEKREYQEILSGARVPTRGENLRLMITMLIS
jgi:2-polyprenyl-6-methoxyphenol hydroxylase-like FAD-dependent oxidoreductase